MIQYVSYKTTKLLAGHLFVPWECLSDMKDARRKKILRSSLTIIVIFRLLTEEKGQRRQFVPFLEEGTTLSVMYQARST